MAKATGETAVTFPPGRLGLWRTLPAYQLPVDALYDASNVIYRNGVLQARPGLTKLSATFGGADPAFDSGARGAFFMFKQDGDPIVLANTNTKLWRFDFGPTVGWTDVTGTATVNGDLDQLGRFTSLQVGSVIKVLFTNGQATPALSDDGGAFAPAAGSPPPFTDVATSADRFIGISPPYNVQWSSTYATDFPALNFRDLSDTPDQVVAVRPLGSLGFVVYKTFSIWAASAQAGPPSQAFRFQHLGWFDGPASPSAVVDAQGIHYYMSPTGRIAYFDGAAHRWIADGAWPYLEADIDPLYTNRIHGAYDPRHHEVYFWYPRVGDEGALKGFVAVCLPRPMNGIQDFAAFPGVMSVPIHAAATLNIRSFNAWVMVFETGANTYPHMFVGTTDNGTAFAANCQTGLAAVKGINRVEIEPFLQRGPGFGTVDLRAVTSHSLNTAGGTISSEVHTIDLEQSPIEDPKGFAQVSGRFVGLRLHWTSTSTVRYQGAHVATTRYEQSL